MCQALCYVLEIMAMNNVDESNVDEVATGTTIHMNYNMNGVHGLRITMQLEVPSFQGAYILMAEGKSR